MITDVLVGAALMVLGFCIGWYARVFFGGWEDW